LNGLPTQEAVRRWQASQFHDALKRMVDAGFEKRILYGSDQKSWPDAITESIDAIQSASLLGDGQKRMARSATSCTTTPRASCA